MNVELAIGYIGLSEVDISCLKKIMSAAVIKGEFKYRWVISKIQNADFVIASPGSADKFTPLQDCTIALLAGESDVADDSLPRISWPLRYEELIPMLYDVESRVAGANDECAKASNTRVQLEDEDGPQSPLERLALLLKDCDNVAGVRQVWRVEGICEDPIFVIPGQSDFLLRGSLARIRTIQADARLTIVPVPVEDVDMTIERKPLVMLKWFVGVNSGSLGLFQWVKERDFFKLKRFPAFQYLPHTPDHRRVAAALTRPCRNVDQIATLTGSNQSTIAGFINASSLCNYLAVANTAIVAPRAGPRANSGRRALLQSFRSALGMR